MLEQDEYDRRILIVDDNDAIHDDFRKVLLNHRDDSDLLALERMCFDEPDIVEPTARIHFNLSHALQGESGVQMAAEALAKDESFDMAFVDMRMPPGWDGIKTIKELWKVDPELEVVICSAYSDHSWHEIITELGQNHHLLILKKPFDNAEVLQMSLALTEKRRMSRIASLKMDDIARLVVERTEELRQQKVEVDAMLLDLMSLVGPDAVDSASATSRDAQSFANA